MFDEGTPDVLDGKLVERHRERVHRITEESRVITRPVSYTHLDVYKRQGPC